MPLCLAAGAFKRSLFLFVLILSSSFAIGQLTANFTIDKPTGCAPLTGVSFTNTTTGASAAASYQWDFGNGNTSTLKSPGATYTEEKTYNVTLTVKDGANTSTKTQQITVYKKPKVDFSPSATKGCVPFPVTFTSNSTAGDGTISEYYWDFGDGTNQKTANATQSHTYTFAQKSPVGLTVTNSFGCYATLQKPDLIEALPGINVAFAADKTVVCKTSDPVKFTNTSTGPTDITYLWDFGDGTTSTDKEPVYTYNKKGVFTVKLTVTSAGGCTQTLQKAAYLNVANFTSDFDVPALICQNNTATFTNRSTPSPTNSNWQVNNQFFNSSTSSAPYSFTAPGQYNIKLTNTFGTCQDVVSKDVVVKESPKMNGFIANLGGVCGAPVTVQFKDTTATAVKWLWNFSYPYSSATATDKEPTYTFTSQGFYTVGLTVSDADGCSTTRTQGVNISKPNINIQVIKTTGGTGTSGCGGLTITFAATPANELTTYQWDFGDGVTSTDAQPVHSFTKTGTYPVKLNYTTTNGCNGIANFNNFVSVYDKPSADFTSLTGTTICGNTPVTFQAISANGPVTQWNWYLDNSNYYYSYGSTFITQFTKDTTYTITLIANNYGCRDTVTKKNYITVLPPFPKIQTVINTCNGTRGAVTFTDASKKALQWTWDYGDGTTSSFSTSTPTVTHTYTKTGTYKVVLTAVNDQCSVRDSVTAYVLLKQAPQLSATQTEICGSDKLNIQVNNFEANPYYNYSNSFYGLNKIEYGDGTTFTGTTSSQNTYWTTTFGGTLQPLEVGKKNLRVITRSSFFGCLDTSNYVPLVIKGPAAKFNITSNNVCYKSHNAFADASTASNNIPITKWEWNYGDGNIETFTVATNPVKYTYANPGQYSVVLKVTDAEGCSAVTPSFTNYAQAYGPKAAFTYSPTSISPNATVNFYNSTNNYNSNNTQYKWIFKDGTTSTSYNTTKYYPVTGTDTVKLIARNPTTGCTDTFIQPITIKNVNASFTYTSSSVNNNNCTPVTVKFTNTSVNVTSVSWVFGDGSRADNQNFPSHTYYQPGEYIVTLIAKAPNGVTDSVKQTIIIKGPYATLKADVLTGCGSQTVTLSAVIRNAVSYTWDFGDGTVKQTSDTFAVHIYTAPGIYIPALSLKDAGGCPGSSAIPDKIIIDTLNISITKASQRICDSTQVQFQPNIVSLAEERLQQKLNYKWDFGTGILKDTANTRIASFAYNQPGKYVVHLTVTSPYGCMKETTDTVEVFKKPNGSISGPPEICQGGAAQFVGTAVANSSVGWQWIFNNGNTSAVQNPAAQTYNSAGTFEVKLIVSSNGCYDTTAASLLVHAKPAINILPKNAAVCLGKSVQLNATGGTGYTWFPTAGLNNYNTANPVATPAVTSTYAVEATNQYGCKNQDSIVVIVAGPFKIKVPADTFVCRGNSLQLYATGAASYKWINNIAGLNNAQTGTPVAVPTSPTVYTVVGTDAYGCFTDTAAIKVGVESFPTVSAGPDLQVETGAVIQLKPSGSSDVTKWKWSPADYLSCTNCQSPISAPRTNISYVVKAENKFGCAVADTVNIKLVCVQSHVFIPTAFTPNKDFKNDAFYIKGSGVKMIKFLKIFSRTGEVIFERTNFNVNDASSGWDGTSNGYEMPPGAYVYFAELICDTGEVFERKGTVVLIR